MSLRYKLRRLWRLAVATHPRTQADWVLSCGFRGAGPMSWNPLQAAKQRSCGYVSSPISPTSVPSGHGVVQSYVLHGADWCSAMGGCGATARRHSLLSLSAYRLKNMLFMSHANITQRVKSCYKIRINSRESKSCFYGVLLRYYHYNI